MTKACVVLLLFFLVLASCEFLDTLPSDNGIPPGDEGPGDNDLGEDDDNDGDTPEPIAGFDLELATGSSWEFYWEYQSSTSWWSSYDNGSSESSDGGYVTITLAEPATVAGYDMFLVNLSGEIPSPWQSSFWEYLGVSGASLIGSLDGSTIKIIVNGDTGRSEYSFFLRYTVPLDIDLASFSAMASAPAPYTTSCFGADYNSSYDDTISIPGYDPIDGDVSTLTINEFHKAGVGPLGLSYYDYLKDVTGPSSWDTIIINWDYSLVSTTLDARDGFSFPIPPWQVYGEMPEIKRYANAVVLNDEIHLLGGRELYTAKTAMYSEDADGNWLTRSPVPDEWVTSTSGSGACIRQGQKLLPETIHFAMKYNYGLSRVIRAYSYNPISDSWSSYAESTFSMDVYDCFMYGNDFLYVLCSGGQMMEYDFYAIGDNFTYWGTIPGAEELTYASALVYNDAIYIVGQYNPYGTTYTTGMFVYNGESWEQVAWIVDSLRRWNPALAVHNDRLYIIGGNEKEVVSCSVTTGTVSDWQIHPSMLYGGSGLDALVVGDQILVFGCDEGTKIEVFTP